jgi:hypothetical protein
MYLQVYTGKEGNRPEVGQASRVVRDLTRDLVGCHHHLYMDNFFTSPALFEELFTDGLYATGTCRANRKGWPAGLHKKVAKNSGDHLSLQCENLTATSWKDKKQVNFLSTVADPTKFQEVRRRQKDGSIVTMLAPEVVGNYRAHMGGVDRGDQLRTQYPTARKSNKWWTYLYHFGLDTAIANAFILMKASPNHQLATRRGNTRERTQLEFRQSLVSQMLGIDGQTRAPRVAMQHWPEVQPKRARCRHCLNSGVRRESIYGCNICHQNLCVTCFKPWHVRRGEAVQADD